MSIDINAVTVCVNFSHYLKHCISNKKYFKRWVIVTHEDDTDTIELCKKHDLEYILSKKIYERVFNKGAAINEGFDYLGKDKEWYCHIDADILLHDNFASSFSPKYFSFRIYFINLFSYLFIIVLLYPDYVAALHDPALYLSFCTYH